MVPPDALFGVIPVWVGVYALTLLTFAVAGYAVYRRVFRLVLQGRPEARFDRPLTRSGGSGRHRDGTAQGAATGGAHRPPLAAN